MIRSSGNKFYTYVDRHSGLGCLNAHDADISTIAMCDI